MAFNHAPGPSGDASIPHLDVPVTLALLASNSLHPDIYSPVGTLIIPFYRRIVRNGYIIVIGIELLTAMLIKWAVGPAPTRITLPGSTNQAVPDMYAFNQTYRLPSSTNATVSSATRPASNRNYGKTNLFSNSKQQELAAEEAFQSPLIPTRGLTINLALSAPAHSVHNIAGIAYNFELKSVEKAPGYLIPLILVFLYFVLQPFYRSHEETRHS